MDTKASEGAGIPEPDYVPSKEEKEEIKKQLEAIKKNREISDDDLPF